MSKTIQSQLALSMTFMLFTLTISSNIDNGQFNKIISGENNIISSGRFNVVAGNKNGIVGNRNNINGNSNEVNGNRNIVVGNGNRVVKNEDQFYQSLNGRNSMFNGFFTNNAWAQTNRAVNPTQNMIQNVVTTLISGNGEAKDQNNVDSLSVSQSPSVQETIPSAEETIPSAEETIPSAQDAIPSAQDTIPSAEETIPSAEDTIPSAEDTIPSAQDTIPSAEETIPSAEETIPSVQIKSQSNVQEGQALENPTLSLSQEEFRPQTLMTVGFSNFEPMKPLNLQNLMKPFSQSSINSQYLQQPLIFSESNDLRQIFENKKDKLNSLIFPELVKVREVTDSVIPQLLIDKVYTNSNYEIQQPVKIREVTPDEIKDQQLEEPEISYEIQEPVMIREHTDIREIIRIKEKSADSILFPEFSSPMPNSQSLVDNDQESTQTTDNQPSVEPVSQQPRPIQENQIVQQLKQVEVKNSVEQTHPMTQSTSQVNENNIQNETPPPISENHIAKPNLRVHINTSLTANIVSDQSQNNQERKKDSSPIRDQNDKPIGLVKFVKITDQTDNPENKIIQEPISKQEYVELAFDSNHE